MKTPITMALLLAALTGGPLVADTPCDSRRVAFSFDDAPTADTVVMTGMERTERIIKAMREGGIQEAIVFSVSSRIDGRSVQRMHQYANAGHIIANHSHTHPNLHRVGSEVFLADVETAHQVLSKLPGFQPWFRFPYLNEGSTVEQRDAVRAGLGELGYRDGYVTIDNFDFYIDRLIREAYETGREIDLAAVESLYVEMILGAAAHYDSIACQWLDRSPRHVLLLHENDAAALFLPALTSALRAEGWQFVSASEAYSDEMADAIPDTLFLGQGRVAALAEIAGADEEQLRHEGENFQTLRAGFEISVKPKAQAGSDQ